MNKKVSHFVSKCPTTPNSDSKIELRERPPHNSLSRAANIWLVNLTLFATFCFPLAAFAQPTEPLGGPAFTGWISVQSTPDGAALNCPSQATFQYPGGPRGVYKHGFRMLNDSTRDWIGYWGIRLQLQLTDAREIELSVSILPTERNGAPARPIPTTLRLSGQGWHTLTLPWSAFQFDQVSTAFLRRVEGLTLAARFTDNAAPGKVLLRDVRLIKAPEVALECAVRGQAAPKGQIAQYTVQVSNCTDQPQSITLSLIHHGWEVMDAAVQPPTLQLHAGETQPCTVTVNVSDRVPPGGHEEQMLQAIADGNASVAAHLSFITVSQLPHPYIMHTAAGWQEVRDKVRKYPWAKTAQDAFVRTAQAWIVPEIAKPPGNDPDDTMGPFLFHTTIENDLLACAYSWELTGNKEHAEKVATFLRRLSDPVEGYPKTLRGCNQSLVQEGHFFQHIAMAYDMIQDANLLTDADRKQIAITFRIFMDTMEREAERGSINNWNLSEATGAFYCALAMQDLVAADRFFAGPSGIEDQLVKGTMDDGWWYECSISYNMWCASEFTQAALAYQSFGANFLHMWIPASFSKNVLLSSELSGGIVSSETDPEAKRKPFGMNPDVFGPNTRSYRTITDLWNSLLPFIDYRGIMFGVNDSTENQVTGNRTEVSGQPFELAYYAYRDPKYAAIIKLGRGPRDLLYGVPELPENTPASFNDSAYADNVGLVMLRSQTENRPIREQIQAVLHYGTHGWAHGHYDRTDLLSLMRYGRSFYNPESVFYVYEPFMYKFYTQTSLNHNMVVVDEKMQEATPGKRLLFHTGKLIQTTAVETTARWSNPPYGGMVYDYVPVKTFEEKTWREGRYVPIPPNPPAYGTLTGFTEPILQRRLMIVTDDYVVLADYLKGTQPHTFENLFSIKGFQGLDAPTKQFLRHEAQWNTDPIGGAQFVTDCNWYSARAPAISHFQTRWGPGADNSGMRSIGNEDGVLKMDIHTLWPPSQQIMIATAPEQHDVEKRLFYNVSGDGKTLAEGRFGAWILGQGNIDVPVTGIKNLELQTKTELSKKPTLFWANAKIIMQDGKQIALSQLPMKFENVVPVSTPNRDYSGGPVKIAGNEYATSIPAEPDDSRRPGMIRVDLTGVNAVKFQAVIGSDYPPGDESQRRKTYAIRSQGTEANFLTIIEPYEDKAMIKSATASDAGALHVELTDGRAQDITIQNMDGSSNDIDVVAKESKDGRAVRSESTDQP